VDRQPDVSLVELQVELWEACGTEVSLSMVLHSLQREGYTMKTVCLHRQHVAIGLIGTDCGLVGF
ncbi:hypothetical protein EDB85DRAFT_1878941, partial [Lactarius pseudohatsudake]